jgi:hypothetical protein
MLLEKNSEVLNELLARQPSHAKATEKWPVLFGIPWREVLVIHGLASRERHAIPA